RCDNCGWSGSERLRPARAKLGGNGKPRHDADAKRRAFETAQRGFDPELQNLEEEIEKTKREFFPEDETEPAAQDATSDAAEGVIRHKPDQAPEPEPEPEPKAPTIEEASAYRRALVAAGYVPIPLYGKSPPIFGKNNQRKGLPGWSDIVSVTDAMSAM